MRYALAVIALLCVSTVAAAQTAIPIRSNGSSTNRIDIVILGDGYTAAQLSSGVFANHAQAVVTQWFAQEPYKEYANYFNVFRIETPSAQSGADHPERSEFRDTAFDGTYNCANIQRLTCVNTTKVNQAVSASGLAADAREIILVLLNDPEYGGSGGSIAVASTHSTVVELVLHEVGHSFGFLADEYGGPPPPSCVNTQEPSEANATANLTRATLKWNAWVSGSTSLPTSGTTAGVPGAYQGARYCDTGLYRPTYNSKMRSLGQPFEPINVEQHVRRVYNFVSPIDTTSPAASNVEVSGGTVEFSASVLTPATHALTVEWRVDGAVVGTGTTLQLSTNSLTRGVAHTVTVTVTDATTMVRTDTTGALSESRTWNLTVTGPAVRLSPSSLQFVGTNNNGTLTVMSPAQPFTVTFEGVSNATWTVQADQPWIQLSTTGGTGSGTVSVGIQNPGNLLGGSTTVTANVRVTAAGVSNSPQVVSVTLTLVQGVQSLSPPIGQVDTPTQNAAGVQGAIGVTGWAIDDVGVAKVEIYRNCLPADAPASCQMLLGQSVVFVGDAAFLAGARPDVAAAFSTYPLNNRAGWGYLMLTPMLPNVPGGQPYGGQGALTIFAFAIDLEGNRKLLGRSSDPASPQFATPTSITMDNASIAKPFGAIDTPAQGATISGVVNNFGWVLTPDSNATAESGDILVPTTGSTMTVFIDSMPVAQVAYNQCRGSVGNPVPTGTFCNDDVASIFGHPTPQGALSARSANPTRYRNLDAARGAIGAYTFNTATLTNGLHTIAWSVTDSAGRTEGIGSRFFVVLNSGADQRDRQRP